MNDKEIVDEIANLCVSDDNKCHKCRTELITRQFEGYGSFQPYCENCDKFHPNQDSEVLQTIFELLDKRNKKTEGKENRD